MVVTSVSLDTIVISGPSDWQVFSAAYRPRCVACPQGRCELLLPNDGTGSSTSFRDHGACLARVTECTSLPIYLNWMDQTRSTVDLSANGRNRRLLQREEASHPVP